MAFGKSTASTEAAEIKRYIGVGSAFVLAVNPTKSELEKIYNTTLENDIEYVGTTEVNGQEVPQVRIDFIVKTDAEKNDGIELVTKLVLFVSKAYRFNKDQTKVQVIDKYGRTAWVTKEQMANHEIPVYSNGPANLDKDYRPAYIGEENLTNFIKTYLNIPDVMRYINGSWVLVDNPQDSECRLDNIDSYFKGDFKELTEAIALQPTNKVKLMFGVRSTDEGKQYQAVYNQMFLRNNTNNYARLEKDLVDRKANGAYATTEFALCNLKEFKVEETNFNSTPTPADDPFAPAAEDTMPW